MDDPAEQYERYKASLSALEKIPGKLAAELESARTARENARKTAYAAYNQHLTRIASLRRNVQSRYEAAVLTLREHEVRLPLQVRGAAEVPGEEKDLVQALEAQAAAAAAIDACVSKTTARAEKDATSRAANAREAAAALRRRQENLHRDRRGAADRARLAADAARRRNIWIVIAVALMLLTAAVISLTVFNHN